jgi:hypothetical protein
MIGGPSGATRTLSPSAATLTNTTGHVCGSGQTV